MTSDIELPTEGSVCPGTSCLGDGPLGMGLRNGPEQRVYLESEAL
jgi:hypothetical protein